jgi:hypothetical protein
MKGNNQNTLMMSHERNIYDIILKLRTKTKKQACNKQRQLVKKTMRETCEENYERPRTRQI